jgi:hypothetical protein
MFNKCKRHLNKVKKEGVLNDVIEYKKGLKRSKVPFTKKLNLIGQGISNIMDFIGY